MAAKTKDEALIKLLLEHGANPKLANTDNAEFGPVETPAIYKALLQFYIPSPRSIIATSTTKLFSQLSTDPKEEKAEQKRIQERTKEELEFSASLRGLLEKADNLQDKIEETIYIEVVDYKSKEISEIKDGIYKLKQDSVALTGFKDQWVEKIKMTNIFSDRFVQLSEQFEKIKNYLPESSLQGARLQQISVCS